VHKGADEAAGLVHAQSNAMPALGIEQRKDRAVAPQVRRLNGCDQGEARQARQGNPAVDAGVGAAFNSVVLRLANNSDRVIERLLADAGAIWVGVGGDHADQPRRHRSSGRIRDLERDRLAWPYGQTIGIAG